MRNSIIVLWIGIILAVVGVILNYVVVNNFLFYGLLGSALVCMIVSMILDHYETKKIKEVVDELPELK
jgi:hypothetical protein